MVTDSQMFDWVCHLKSGRLTVVSVPVGRQHEIRFLERLWSGKDRSVQTIQTKFVYPTRYLWHAEFRKRKGKRIRLICKMQFIGEEVARMLAHNWEFQRRKGLMCPYFTDIVGPDDIPF